MRSKANSSDADGPRVCRWCPPIGLAFLSLLPWLLARSLRRLVCGNALLFDLAVDPDELTARVKERKGSHHAPKQLEVVDRIPVTAVGKPDKKALRAEHWPDAGRQVG